MRFDGHGDKRLNWLHLHWFRLWPLRPLRQAALPHYWFLMHRHLNWPRISYCCDAAQNCWPLFLLKEVRRYAFAQHTPLSRVFSASQFSRTLVHTLEILAFVSADIMEGLVMEFVSFWGMKRHFRNQNFKSSKYLMNKLMKNWLVFITILQKVIFLFYHCSQFCKTENV